MKKKQLSQKCNACYGYGLWPIGRADPIGPIDAGEWKGRVKKCPECGAGDVK